MILNIILLIILIGSLVGILYIIRKKLPLIAMVDIDMMHQQEAEKKKNLLEQKLKRQLQKVWEEKIKILIIKIFKFLKNIVQKPPAQP